MGGLDGKVALITGAARGMGVVHAKRLAAEGTRVVLTDVLDAEGQAAADAIGSHAIYLHHDVTSEHDWRRVVGNTETAFAPINVLVNKASIVLRGPIEDFSLEDYRRAVEITRCRYFSA